jgi:hypothetical protein
MNIPDNLVGSGRVVACPRCRTHLRLPAARPMVEVTAIPPQPSVPPAAFPPSSPPVISCPHCRVPIAVDSRLAGQVVACPQCRGHLLMPGTAAAPPTQPPAAYGHPPRHASSGRRKMLLVLGGSLAAVLLLGLTVFALLRFFSSGPGLTNELRYLPDGSRFILSLNARALLESSAGKKFLASAAWRDLNRGLVEREGEDFEAMLEKHTGIPLREYNRITIGGTFNMGREPEFVMVIKAQGARRFHLKVRDFEFNAPSSIPRRGSSSPRRRRPRKNGPCSRTKPSASTP